MPPTNKYICIHGHFYQPPRENAWLETVEQQPSARPWHDWNERISFECYAPNAAARILDGEGVISKIRNNYNRISFNFGPTLLSWLEENDPEAYQMILAADKRSMLPCTLPALTKMARSISRRLFCICDRTNRTLLRSPACSETSAG